MHQNHPISIAPMMDYTDRHFRYLLRLIAPQLLLYTEMITADAILHGDRERLLGYDAAEHPLALQLGGSNPKALAQCAKIAEDYGYDEVNLNVGCPSSRVQEGRFGACLMKEPKLVAECVAAMRAVVRIPVTVKTRIGVDEQDSYPELLNFMTQVSASGCESFIVHARKAWLKGLSPKENREVPPLRYDVVYQIKQDFPQLQIVINGGFQSAEQVRAALEKVDGVMIGRLACQNPYFFADFDSLLPESRKDVSTAVGIYSSPYVPRLERDGATTLDAVDKPRHVGRGGKEAVPLISPARTDILKQYLPYMQEQLAKGIRLTSLTRHLLGLFYGTSGARAWRRQLSENAHKEGVGLEIVEKALTIYS